MKIRNPFVNIRFEIYLLCIYFLLAPFEDLLNFGYGTILKYISILYFFIYILKALLKNSKNGFSAPILMPLILLIILFWVSAIWSINLETTIGRNIAYTLLPVFFVIIFLNSYTSNELKIITASIILGAFSLSIYMVFNYQNLLLIGYGATSARITLGEGNDPNNLAAQLNLGLLVSFFAMIEAKKVKKIFFLLITLLIFLATLLTGSRGALVGISFAMFHYFFLHGRSIDIKRKLIVALLIISGLLIIFNYLPDNIAQRLFQTKSYSYDFETHASRSDLWKTAFRKILPGLPIGGYGAGCTPLVFSKYLGFAKGMHNTYLNMIVELGWLGLPLFLIFLLNFYRRLKSKDQIIEITMLISILVISLFLDAFAKKFLWNVLMFIAISFRATNIDIHKNPSLDVELRKQ